MGNHADVHPRSQQPGNACVGSHSHRNPVLVGQASATASPIWRRVTGSPAKRAPSSKSDRAANQHCSQHRLARRLRTGSSGVRSAAVNCAPAPRSRGHDHRPLCWLIRPKCQRQQNRSHNAEQKGYSPSTLLHGISEKRGKRRLQGAGGRLQVAKCLDSMPLATCPLQLATLLLCHS